MIIKNFIATDIPDAWFQCVYALLDDAARYTIQHGSFVAEERLEFDWVSIYIKYPYSEPYHTMLPKIPPNLGLPNPVADDYIEQYIPYLMTSDKKEDEDYTYGSRIAGQIEHFIELLRETPNTNQAILQVAQPNDCLLGDPPCLRHIDMRIRYDELIFYPYFRSWDLWAGFPANLAGIAVLQKYMADEIGVISGPMIASSKGLHIYKYVEELAKLRCGK